MTNKNNTKFRFKCKFLLLTYKTWIKVKDIISFITKKCKKEIKVKIAHELGDKHHNYKHTHILIYFISDKRIDWTSPKKFDYEGIHPHWCGIKTEEHFLNVFEYLDKENCVFSDLEGNEYPVNTGFSNNLIELIQKHKSFKAVVCDTSISYEITNKMKWARCVFDARPKINLSLNLILNPFQEKVLISLNQQNDRQILWCYDPKGNNPLIGKSILTNWLLDNKCAFMCNGGKLSDISHAYDEEEIVVFDLPRTTEEFTPYKAMECFKDGRIFSPKYNSCIKRFKPCKVVCFANYRPNLTKLSIDRWIVWDLTNYPQTPIGSLNIKENLGGDFSNHYFNDE